MPHRLAGTRIEPLVSLPKRQRHQAAGDGGTAAAGRAAGRPLQVVRVVAGAVMRVLGGEAVGVFVHVERTDAHRTGGAHPPDQERIGAGGWLVALDLRAGRP